MTLVKQERKIECNNDMCNWNKEGECIKLNIHLVVIADVTDHSYISCFSFKQKSKDELQGV